MSTKVNSWLSQPCGVDCRATQKLLSAFIVFYNGVFLAENAIEFLFFRTGRLELFDIRPNLCPWWRKKVDIFLIFEVFFSRGPTEKELGEREKYFLRQNLKAQDPREFWHVLV